MTRPRTDRLNDDTQGPRRVRMALVILMVGVGLLLLALALAMLRSEAASEIVMAPSPVPPSTMPASQQRTMAATLMLVYGTLLLLVFVVAALALVAVSRRYRQRLARQKASPTPVDDVWSQHRLPEETMNGDARSPDPPPSDP